MFGSNQDSPDFKIKLGAKVRDKITGFEGIVIGRFQWLHNCNTYNVKPLKLKDGKPQDACGFDEPQLEVIKEKVHQETRRTGGPCESPAPSNT